MKKVLIGVNCLLGGVILLLTMANLTPGTATKPVSPVSTVRRNAKRQATEKIPAKPAELPPLDRAVEKAVAADVFSNVRSPLANIRSGRSDMTLVGTFKMGDIEGAIIRQTNVQRQMNPFIMQAMRMGMSGGQRPGGAGGYTRWSAMGNGRQSNTPVKQYVRVGEMMSNGYILSEVSRTRAVLVRGNDKMELELQDPSKNRTAGSRAAGPRLNATQQFQQAQMFMQSQMLRTLQDMQRGGAGGVQRTPPANRGRR